MCGYLEGATFPSQNEYTKLGGFNFVCHLNPLVIRPHGKRRFLEITGEIIRKSEAHLGRTSFQTWTWSIYWHVYVHDIRMEAAVEKCCSVIVSDLQAWTYIYWTASCVLCMGNTFFFPFSFSHTMVFLVGPHALCLFGMADWLNQLRAFIIYTVFLVKKKKCKRKCKEIILLTGCGDACRSLIQWRHVSSVRVGLANSTEWMPSQNWGNLLSELNVQCLTSISDAFSASFTSIWPSFPQFHCTPNKSVPTLHYTCKHLLNAVPWISEGHLFIGNLTYNAF